MGKEVGLMPGGRERLRSTFWLGLILAGPLALPLSTHAQDRSTRVGTTAVDSQSAAKTIFYRSRSFRIPVTIPEDALTKVREVRLWVSDDFGYNWKPLGPTTPDRPEFPFKAVRDGEYWFAIQTLDLEGKIYPANNKEVEPSLKVVIDTTLPTIVLESGNRQGAEASVRWELQDENLVLRTFALEYQPEGAGAADWRSVPLEDDERVIQGSKTWSTGTFEAIRVRASVTDRAKNTRQVELKLSSGIASRPGQSGGRRDRMNTPPPVAPISSRRETPGRPEDSDPFASVNPSDRASNFSEDRVDQFPERNENSTQIRQPDQTLLVGNPRFPLQYEVEGAGPGGVAKVQLWVTHDGGRSWFPQAEDADKTSPYMVDLGGAGTFGLWLSVQGGSGLGDPAPAPGDKPQSWVEVDTTPPVVQLDPPRVGTGNSSGKLLITWRASDPHLGSRPVILSYRAEGTDSEWIPVAGPLDNTGQHIWVVPPGIPPKFRIRIEVIDSVGHRGTAESSPIVVDRAKPKGRILGLEPGGNRGTNQETRR